MLKWTSSMVWTTGGSLLIQTASVFGVGAVDLVGFPYLWASLKLWTLGKSDPVLTTAIEMLGTGSGLNRSSRWNVFR